ncbi:MAG: hypothetical protein OEY86_00805 [Nitrospira sp.]|nr:hypothetical protein [Nitrospira sp.]
MAHTKKRPKKTHVGVKIEGPLLNRLKESAARNGVSLSEEIRRWLNAHREVTHA